MLQWIIEEAIQRGRSSDLEIVDRLMLVNFAAIHTSSNVGFQLSWLEHTLTSVL